MTAARAIKGASQPGQIVAVLSSLRDLDQAKRMRRPPDLFEMRLDALHDDLTAVERTLPSLVAPLIITARHPMEGGLHNLSASRRRRLLDRFLPHAAYLDVELRSAVHFRKTLDAAQNRKVGRIISVHDFRRAPAGERLDQWARAAQVLSADVFKIVVRTENAEQLEVLAKFFEHRHGRMAISAMGVGALGPESRIYFAQHGSALNYAHLGRPQLEGQFSLTQMRRCLASRP